MLKFLRHVRGDGANAFLPADAVTSAEAQQQAEGIDFQNIGGQGGVAFGH